MAIAVNTNTVVIDVVTPVYTCYIPRCKTIRSPNGSLVSVCEPVAISSNVPCPETITGGYSNKVEACEYITCGGTT